MPEVELSAGTIHYAAVAGALHAFLAGDRGDIASRAGLR